MKRSRRELKKNISAAARSVALLATLFYIINVQSVHHAPKHMARNDELYTEWGEEHGKALS